MSSQQELNENYWMYVLYYCNYVNEDETVYQTDLSDVCSPYFDGENNIQFADWQIVAYGVPAPATLMAYTLATVTTFFDNFYTIPATIAMSQAYQISTTALGNIYTNSQIQPGMSVLDTTAQIYKIWNGSTWVSFGPTLFLALAGGTMSGALAMGSNGITGVTSLQQSTPSAISIYTTASNSNSLSAATGAVISVGSFSQSHNPNSDFSYTAGTGEAKYTGATTRYFRVAINYSVDALAPGSTQTLTTFLSVSGATTPVGAQNVFTFLTGGQQSTFPGCLSYTVQLAQNATVQLAALYTATASVTFRNVSVAISQV